MPVRALATEVESLKQSLADAAAEIVALRAALPEADEESTLSVSFGTWDELEALRTARWPELGGAVAKIT